MIVHLPALTFRREPVKEAEGNFSGRKNPGWQSEKEKSKWGHWEDRGRFTMWQMFHRVKDEWEMEGSLGFGQGLQRQTGEQADDSQTRMARPHCPRASKVAATWQVEVT